MHGPHFLNAFYAPTHICHCFQNKCISKAVRGSESSILIANDKNDSYTKKETIVSQFPLSMFYHILSSLLLTSAHKLVSG